MSTDPNAYDADNAESSWEAEEKSLSAGNTRLAIIVGAIVLLGGFGYAMMPGGKTSNSASAMMSSVMLDGEATVTGAAAKPEAAPATEEETAKAEAAAAAAKTTATTTPAAIAAAAAAAKRATPAANANNTIEPIAATSVTAPVEAAPAPAPAVVAEAPATTNLTGRVLDEDGQPLAGATIFLKGSRKIASADANGNYTIEVPVGENTLTYGYGGYQDQVMRVRTGQSGNVTLLPKEGTRRRKH
ncbi:carboxypeptidase-like regulatory domain-containing protein [Hymenobacter sp. DG25B]|uniref:carboxypeptidase-like regulatory domain-containing protein n=1 Tax=Hymenobacter sp. DG25B TaxID=1385664 RepID=UPI0009E37D18|nr:carboxypeptidase-like regulatory domain-containing protein [Hymenobacter sp. DG25B]